MLLPSRDSVIRLVQTAAEQNTLEGIKEMLRVVTEEMKGWGALIWMASPGSDIQAGTGRLFVLGYWTPNNSIRVWHELPLDSSMTGWALKNNEPGPATLGDPRIATPTPRFIELSETTDFCVAPMRMVEGSSAVLEVYRQGKVRFSDDEVGLLDQFAAVLPGLYASLTSRVGFQLQDRISEIRRGADQKNSPAKEAVGEMLTAIHDVFQSLELSIFLHDMDDEPDTFPLYDYRVVWEGPWTDRAVYRPGEGATGYVIQHGKTVRIVDLSRFEEDRKWIEAEYPGIRWNNSLKIQDRARDHFGSDPENAPPLSFLCVPVRSGINTFGAIRCCGSIRNPFYMDVWQAHLLEAVAARIGSWWQNRLREDQKDREIQSWKLLVKGFDAMNRLVERILAVRQIWVEKTFFREAMRLAHEVIPNTDNSDVRLIDGEELVTSAVYGRDWEQHSNFKTARWRLNPPNSAAAWLVQEKKGVQVFEDMTKVPKLSPIFRDTKKLILAPIATGDHYFGVLCIRSKSPRAFPSNTELMAQLLGQQLGLYCLQANQIKRLRKAEQENKELIETQGRTIGDVQHQVKSPILSAHRLAQSLINNGMLPRLLRPQAEQIRGLCRKVSRVVGNMGVFSDLSADKSINLKKALLLREKLLQMLRELCADHQSTVDPERQVSFKLDEGSFQDLTEKDRNGKLVEVDTLLLEQCVNNLLDNASKYSYGRTTVHVSGGFQARAEEFFISVANQGLEVKPEEATKLKQRGYRAPAAIGSSGEGSGIGLWIVDEIMKAHSGRLAISPTQNKVTDVRLVLPVTKGLENLAEKTYNTLGRR